MAVLSTRDILLEYVSPALGAIFANLMFLAPLSDVRRAVKTGSLGHLNPTPWAVMTGNTIGWITYSYLLSNHFIFWANAPGFIFSIWLNMAAAKLQYCDRLAENMRSSFVNLVESRRESIHHSLRASMYRASKLNETDTEMNHLEDQIGADRSVPAHEVLDNSWTTIMRSNRNTANEINNEIDENEDNNTLDASDRSIESNHTHHVLHKFTELGALAMEISSGQIEAPAPHEKVVIGIITAWFAFISCIIFIPMNVKQREFIIGIAVNVNMSFFYGAPLSIIWKVMRTRNSSWIHRRTMIMNTSCALFFLAFGFGRMDWFLIIPNGIGVILGGVQLFLRLVIPSSDSSKSSKTDSSVANLAGVISNHPPIKQTVHNDEDYDISRDSETSA